MAAKKNPKADEAYKLYKDGMKLVDIANQLGVPDGTVRRWKSTYEWDNEIIHREIDTELKKMAMQYLKQPNDAQKGKSSNAYNNLINCLNDVIASKNVSLEIRERACELLVKLTCEKGIRKKINDVVRKASFKRIDSINNEQWERCVDYFRNNSGDPCCAYCGKICDSLEKDHIIPYCKGGRSVQENILPACKRCNTSKNKKYLYDWYIKSNVFCENNLKKIISYLEMIGGDSGDKTRTS